MNDRTWADQQAKRAERERRRIAERNACAGIPTEALQPGSVGDLITTLRDAAKKFREYEEIHMRKGSIDGDAKARANAEIAEHCEAALAPFLKGDSDED